MENEFYQFVDLLYIDYEKDVSSNYIGSISVNKAVDITDITENRFISRNINNNLEQEDILFEKENYRVRFGNINYRKFRKKIIELNEVNEFKGVVTYEFLETEVFIWLIDIKENCRAKRTLFNFLKDRISEEQRDEIFYFPVINLEIEKPFQIGQVEFTFFTEEYWDEMYKKTSYNKKDFDSLFRDNYQGKVLASIHTKGVADNGVVISKKTVELAVDILKLLGPTVAFPKRIANFDLDYRLNYLTSTEFLSRHVNKEFEFSLNKKGNYYPTIFTTKIIDEFILDDNKFSNFILTEKNTDIDRLIRQSINLLANSLTQSDLHIRIAHIFTLLESIFIKENKHENITAKTKARMPKLLSLDHNERMFMKQLLDEFYETRHKYVHNAIKLDINIMNMGFFQAMVKNSILRLIDNRHLLNKDNLLKVLDDIKS